MSSLVTTIELLSSLSPSGLVPSGKTCFGAEGKTDSHRTRGPPTPCVFTESYLEGEDVCVGAAAETFAQDMEGK